MSKFWNQKKEENSLMEFESNKYTNKISSITKSPELTLKTTNNQKNTQLRTNLRKIGIIGFDELPSDHFSLTYAIIEYNGLNFLITDRPAKANLHCYIDDLLKHNVKQVIRVCESDYPTEELIEKGIKVTDYQFRDGFPPPKNIIELFLENIKQQFINDPNSKIAIHCVAGLGRAPVMVAIALIEAGMNYLDAVEYIRHKRRGAINLKQLDFLSNYKSSNALRLRKPSKSCRLV